MDSAEMKRVRESFQRPEEPAPESTRPADPPKVEVPPPRRVRDSVRREDPEDIEPTPSPLLLRTPPTPLTTDRPTIRRPPGGWENEPGTGTRRRRESRPAVAVDEVGAAAVKLARTTRRDSAPKLIATGAMIAKAPIDTRAAFVLSLVDGRNSIDAIVDMSGMPEDEVKEILDRLARLGIIALP